nr:immunoglobulin light chain junction region [Macaca mulatta]MOW41582.1 immunoglobulin light chain junction region [Macaca mulatta]MOW42955.1 immunoglobulin light chain junction region [Macaca mulatta]MOW43158.1 immunoglobulin light chain junction region [Macaca mulatta]MOW43501.1 immunoglobulin light chain junction region [Macaca mulatta]
CQQYNNDLFTF